MEIIYEERSFLVVVKPAGVLSTDEAGGLPDLLRSALGDENANIRTVHRLDRAASGLMVVARRHKCAALLSRQIREGGFEKEYFAVIHGKMAEKSGTLCDYLRRDKQERKTYVTTSADKDTQEASLSYAVLGEAEGFSLVRIRLRTGRTHQIRCQFAARGCPLAGDRKYGAAEDGCPLGLFSCHLGFDHPYTGERLTFAANPPAAQPWNIFDSNLYN